MKPKDPRVNWYIEKLEELRKNPKAKIIGLSKEEFLEHVDLLFGPIFDRDNKQVFVEDFRYVRLAIEKILEIDLRKYLEAKGNVPQGIIQAAEDLGGAEKTDDARLIAKGKVDQFIQRQEQLKTANIAQAQEDISQKAQAMVKASLPGSLAKDPTIVKKLAAVIENEVMAGYLETILPEDLSPQVLQKVTQHLIETADLPEQLIAAESSLPPNVAQLVEANLKNLAWSPQTTATIKEMNQAGLVLPHGLREKIPSAGGPFSFSDAVRSPRSFFEKVILSPIAKTAEFVSKAGLDNEEAILQKIKKLRADPRAKPQDVVASEWQLYEASRFRTKNKIYSFFTGLTKGDFEQFKTHLTITRGLGPTDFRVQYVEDQVNRLSMYEQKSRLARFYQRYLHFNRRTGFTRPSFQLGQRKYHLPSAQPAKGFQRRVRDFGLRTGYYRSFVEYPGIRVIRSIPLKKFADFRSFIARKTLQPIFARLGQTAIGQGIKSGIRSIISSGLVKGLVAKLGIKGLTTALGSILPGIGNAIGFAIGLLINKAKDFLSKFKQRITRPEYAVGMGIVGGIFVIGVPGTAGLAIGAPLLALSGIGLAAGAGTFLGGLAAGTTAFFTALFAPFAVPIAAFVISLIIGLMAITLFIVFLTASAFIIPAAPTERVSAYLEVEKTANPSMVNDINQLPLTINYTVAVTAQQPNTTITSAYDEKRVTCTENPPSVGGRTELNLTPSGTNKWTASYSFDVDDSFIDCRLCNTVTAIANIKGVSSGEMTTDTVCVEIGNPPEDCPSGWPMDHGYITQGPRGGYSHPGQEAIDIGTNYVQGLPVYSTHEGEVVDPSGWRDPTVKIKGECNGQTFYSIYTHLRTRNVDAGDHVIKGTIIGTNDHPDPHLHYEFTNLVMEEPYIPINDDELEGCVGVAACGNIQW